MSAKPSQAEFEKPQNLGNYANMHLEASQRNVTSCTGTSEDRVVIEGGDPVAGVQIQDGIIRILELDIQDQKAAAALAEYPQARWAEITRRALKIGLGYMKGGGRD